MALSLRGKVPMGSCFSKSNRYADESEQEDSEEIGRTFGAMLGDGDVCRKEGGEVRCVFLWTKDILS